MSSDTRTPQPVDVRSLQRLALFRALDPGALSALVPALEAYRYRAGAALPHPADPPGVFYLLGSGRVRVYRVAPTGEDVTLLFMHRGDCLQLAARDEAGQLQSAACVADPGLIYTAYPERLRMGAEARLLIERAATAQLRRQMLELCDRLTDVALYSLPERIGRALARLAAAEGQDLVPITQKELASLVGARREQVNRALGRLRAAGTVAYGDGERGIRLLRR